MLAQDCGMCARVNWYIPIEYDGETAFQSRHNTEDFDLFTLDDVDAAFDKIVQLKYSQTVNLKGKVCSFFGVQKSGEVRRDVFGATFLSPITMCTFVVCFFQARVTASRSRLYQEVT